MTTTNIAGRPINQDTRISRVTNGNRTTITETTTVDFSGENTGIVDVQQIPYIRKSKIEFVGYKLRPERLHYIYFDDIDMSKFVQALNIMYLDTTNISSWPSMLSPPAEDLYFNGGNAKIILAETGFDGNVILHLAESRGVTSNVLPTNTVNVSRRSGLDTITTTLLATGNILTYIHRTGVAGANSNTGYIQLARDASPTHNIYVGNVITIVNGTAAGEVANIVSYNAVTRMAQVNPTFSAMSANAIYSIGDYRSQYAGNALPRFYTSQRGHIAGVLHIPDPSANSQYSFYTGDRIFRILDNPNNDVLDYTSRADYRYTTNGLKVDIAQQINRKIFTNTTIITTETVHTDNPTLTVSSTSDPVAQSFYVDELIYPEGVFVPSIDVYFRNKSTWSIVEMQIRPMDGGFPSATEVLPYASTILSADQVNVSETPNVSNSMTRTRFTFPSPVFLNSKQEYAFVIITNDSELDIFVSELGGTVIGSERKVSRQPFLGSMFKSQNGRTFTPIQDEDVMFVINKCVFNESGTVRFNERKRSFADLPVGATANTYVANAPMDMFIVHSDAIEIPGTKLTYNYRATGNSDGVLDSAYTEFYPDEMVPMDERKIVYGPDVATKSFYMQVGMTTKNTDVSPVLFRNRQSLKPQKMLINNMGITNAIVTIANSGNGYHTSNTSLTFGGLTGSGANGYIIANTTTGAIESVIIDAEGSGYFDNVTATIASSNGLNGVILVSGETDKSGGPALARYISKTILLDDGFDAGDLRVYVTAARPQNSDVTVYYKIRNSLDPERMDDKYWKKMVQIGDEFTYATPPDFRPSEYEFRPSATANAVSYSISGTTYTTFNEFKLKIVLSSASTLPPDIPVLFDVRAAALPGDLF